jgi:hypothetical protein
MTNPEILKMRADLALERRKAADLQMTAAGLIPLIRNLLPTYGDHLLLQCDTGKALDMLRRLHDFKLEYGRVQERIRHLSRELGEDE